jgi:hypothetical protein
MMRRYISQIIAAPSRRAILTMLAAQAMPFTTLAGNFNISRQAICKHIKNFIRMPIDKTRTIRP